MVTEPRTIGVAPPGSEDRLGEPSTVRSVDPARYVELPDGSWEEDPFAPSDRIRGFRILDVFGIDLKPGPPGPDLLENLRPRFARFSLERGEEMELLVCAPVVVAGRPERPAAMFQCPCVGDSRIPADRCKGNAENRSLHWGYRRARR